MLAMYLMFGPCGDRYSVDRLAGRAQGERSAARGPPSVSANLAIRLIQIHMCVIYFFAGPVEAAGRNLVARRRVLGSRGESRISVVGPGVAGQLADRWSRC